MSREYRAALQEFYSDIYGTYGYTKFVCIFVVKSIDRIHSSRNGTISTNLVFLFEIIEKLDAIRRRWTTTKYTFDSGECCVTKRLLYYRQTKNVPCSCSYLQYKNCHPIKIFEATSPITHTTVCKCISIDNNGTEVDHTNLDFLNVKHVDFRISTSTKVMFLKKINL